VPVNLTDASEVVDLLGRASASLRESAGRDGCTVSLPPRGRVVVAGDLHDNPVHLDRLLRLARLDAHDDRHLVLQELIHGDRLINGCDLSHRILCRIAELSLAFPGRVHPLLGNHELSQLTGRAVSKGAGNSVEFFDDGLAFVFDDAWEGVRDAIHDFIRAMPLAVRSESDAHGGRLFCSHSLPGAAAMNGFDASILIRAMTDDDYAAPGGSAYRMTWGRDHPPDHLNELGRLFDATLFCVGHRFVETGIEMIGPNAVAINSDHERAAALPIDLARIPDASTAAMSGVPLAAMATAEEQR